jgi:hypothetical protein
MRSADNEDPAQDESNLQFHQQSTDQKSLIAGADQDAPSNQI